MADKTPEEKAFITISGQLSNARTNTATVMDALRRCALALDVEGARAKLAMLKKYADAQNGKYVRLKAAANAWAAVILAPPAEASHPTTSGGALAHDESAFPKELTEKMLDGSKRAGGGSTGARFLTVGGSRYVIKRPSSVTGEGSVSDECLRNEAAGDRMYRAAGIRVPDCKVYEIDGKPVKVAQMIEGAVSLGDYFRKASDKEKEAVKKKLLKGFLLDAALGNWDVVGMSGDNILVDKDGEPWRIDNGSAMGYRAQGTPKKPDEWAKSQFPDEWRTLVGSPNNKAYFGGFRPTDIFSQEVDWDAVLAECPANDKPVVERRVKEIKEMQVRCRGLLNSGIVKDAVDLQLDASYDLVKDGLREAVPKIKVANGDPDLGVFRPNATGGIPLGMSPTDSKMQTVVDKLVAAAKSVNSHAATDGKPNMTTVKAALAAAEELSALKKAGIDTSKWEGSVKELKAVKPSGQKKKVGTVPAYAPQQPVNANLAKHGSITVWKADYIMRGGDPNAKPDWKNYEFVGRCAKSQASNSWTGTVYSDWNDKDHPYACIRKIIEYELTGKNPDPKSGGKNGEVYGFKQSQKDAYLAAWKYYKDPKNKKEMERAKKAVILDRAFTQIELENAGLPYYDPKTQTILLARTEDDNVIGLVKNEKGRKAKKGEFGTFPSRGNGDSFSMFKTVVVEGDNLTIQRVPVALVGDSYLTMRMNKGGGWDDKYLGDDENEAHADENGILEVFNAGRVRSGEDLKPYYEAFLAAEKKRNLPR